MTVNPNNIALEPEALAFAKATSKPPFLYQLKPEEGRKAVDTVQDEKIFKPDVDEEWLKVAGGPTGEVPVRIVRPKGASAVLPVVLYTHGAGWVFGDAHTHDRLVCDLSIGTNAAIVFPEYTRAPDAHYPVQNEQSYAVAQWIFKDGSKHGLDTNRVAIAGDSVGGNMAIALNIMGHQRGDVSFRGAVLFYPVTDASFDTDSYKEFAEGYYLARDGMKWFWDQYTTSQEDRNQITASPLRASEKDLAFFPPTIVINGEADVLRDEGEAFAAKLRRSGVKVTQIRYGGTIHDFVMLNSLHDTPQSISAIDQAIIHLNHVLKK